MRGFTIFLILLSISFYQGQSQEKVKAKIFKKDLQLVEGVIKVNVKESTPQLIQYSPDGKSPYQELDISLVKRIEFEQGQVLETHSVRIPVIIQQYINRSASDYKLAKNILEKEVLLEKVLTGKVSLYLFVDKYDFPHFFVSKDSDSISYLRNETYTSTNLKFRQDHSYQNILFDLANKSGCTSLEIKDFEGLKYELGTLKKIVEQINHCSGSTTASHGSISERRMAIHGGFLGGVASTSIHLDYGNLGRSTNAVYGFYIHLVPEKKEKKTSYVIDFAYTSFSSQGMSTSQNSGVRYLDAQIVTVAPMVKRSFFSGVVGLHGLAGASFGGALKAEETFNGSKFDYRKGLWGIVAGAGFGSQKYSVELVYSVMPAQTANNYLRLQAKVSIF